SEIRAFLISGLGLLGAMICCLLSLAASLPLRYSGILMLVCRIFELFGFAKMFEGCWRQFRRRRLREKAKETDLRMKIYMLAFTCCAIAEAALLVYRRSLGVPDCSADYPFCLRHVNSLAISAVLGK
ncbi:MAG: hypothetical protein ACLSA6_05245, partial [Holdemania massiliensis]